MKTIGKIYFQEILVQLWKSYPSFRNEAKITTWMYRVAINTAITRYRRIKNKPSGISIYSDDFDIKAEEENPDRKEEIDLLYKAINKLSDIEKSIVMLYLEDYCYEDIAEMIGITQNNVRVKMTRIRSKLKIILEPELCK